MPEHSCECGAHEGPVTTAQRERVQRCSSLVDDWLAAVLTGMQHRQAATQAPIQGFLRLAPTLHDAHVRLVGLTTATARRCAQLLPSPRNPQAGQWVIGDLRGHTIDHAPAHVRLGTRLVVAYANGDDDGANDLVIAHLRQLECLDIQHELWRTFMYLSHMYLQIDTHVRECGRGHGLRTIASRLAAAWSRGRE
jgi:hypothetical protein